jgi:hypothetical protein
MYRPSHAGSSKGQKSEGRGAVGRALSLAVRRRQCDCGEQDRTFLFVHQAGSAREFIRVRSPDAIRRHGAQRARLSSLCGW